MSCTPHLRPHFVDVIPNQIDDGVIYISIKYRTAAHTCCCGCGQKVVTPITPTDWQFSYDGVNVSIRPSIGNWSFACQSHYWIKQGNINWSYKFTPDEIRRAREHDHHAAQMAAGEVPEPLVIRNDSLDRKEKKRRWLRRR